MRRFMTVLMASAVLFPAVAKAEVETFKFDKPHTQIIFFVDHMGFAKSSGKFLDYDGAINWDKGDVTKSSVEVTIPVSSLEMGDKTWNEHTLGEKLFDAAKYPTMTFKSTSVKQTGDKTADVTGDLTLHGVTKPVTLAVTYNNTGKHPMMPRMETGFSATANIKRSEFGMTENIPMIGDDVEIRIEVEAYRDLKEGEGAPNP